MKDIRLKIIKLCDNMEERSQGLMNFRKLKEDECAFFIFPKASGHSFWNKNVNYDLSLACLNEKFEIECFMELEKMSTDPVYPKKRNIKYVIEASKDFFDKMKIEVGDYVDFDPDSSELIINKNPMNK